MAELSESFWEDLLDYVEDGTVIPVIGSELVTVRDGDRDLPLYRWLAQRLAAELNLPPAGLPAAFELNDVVSLYLRLRGEREELYPKVHRLLRHAPHPLPEALCDLARLPGLNLFVSLTSDSVLAEALKAAAPGGSGPVDALAYSPSTVRDLAAAKAELRHPAVFHLLGRASSSPDYPICEEDLLEFLHALQDKQRQPKRLFDELRSNHLLILGCGFSNWLARFFLRTARSLQLSQRRRRWDFWVGDPSGHDGRLALFLESFSPDTRFVPMRAADFLAELARRWRERHPPTLEAGTVALPRVGAAVGESPTGAVFLSYASEDLEAAGRLAEGLRSAGLEVWFDRDSLGGGDDWARTLRRGLARCSLFLPVISRQALREANRRRYFWREWNEADDLARGMAADEPFLIPVVIDDSRIDRAALPGSFQEKQGVRLPGGVLTPEVADLLRDRVRAYHRRQRAA